MANVLPLPQIPPGPAKRSGNGAPSDLDSLFEAMDLNRDGFLDAGGEHPSKNCLAQSGGAMGDWAVPPDFTKAEKKARGQIATRWICGCRMQEFHWQPHAPGRCLPCRRYFWAKLFIETISLQQAQQGGWPRLFSFQHSTLLKNPACYEDLFEVNRHLHLNLQIVTCYLQLSPSGVEPRTFSQVAYERLIDVKIVFDSQGSTAVVIFGRQLGPVRYSPCPIHILHPVPQALMETFLWCFPWCHWFPVAISSKAFLKLLLKPMVSSKVSFEVVHRIPDQGFRCPWTWRIIPLSKPSIC